MSWRKNTDPLDYRSWWEDNWQNEPPVPSDYHTPKILYWAYGSNLHVRQMRLRCPDAVKIGPLTVPNAVLRFRGVADVAYLRGAECLGGLWEVSAADEAALDRYEGVDPNDTERGLYAKRYLTVLYQGEKRSVLYYQMNHLGITPPSASYYQTIAQGYEDFGLDVDRLEKALRHSYDRRRKTPFLARRYKLKGRPVLAPRPEERAR